MTKHSENNMYEIIKWPEELAPSRSPIHFTNELEVTASPETIWSLLVDTKAWPSFYPGVENVQLLDGRESLGLGTRFEANLAGEDVIASVQEFEPKTRIAWGGYPKVSEESKAYHAWIITPTPLWGASLDRRNDSGAALNPAGEASSRCVLAHSSEASGSAKVAAQRNG